MMKPKIEQLILEWANERNLIIGTTELHQTLKLTEEVGELSRAVLHGDHDEAVDAIGDCYVVLCNLAAKLGTSLDMCAREAYGEIKDRKGNMVNGTYVKEA